MSRSYSRRSWNSYEHAAHDQSTYFQHSPRREINHHRPTVPRSRITAAASASASFTQRPPWFDSDWNEPTRPTPHPHQQPKRRRPAAINPASSQSHSFHRHYDHKRSRHGEQEHYQPYSNHRSTPNPTAHNRPTQAHRQHQSPPVPPPYRPSMPSSSPSSASPSAYTQYHRHGLIFESPVYHPPLYHQSSMSAHLYQRPSFAFLLTDLLHRTVHTHATVYSESHIHQHPPAASIDLIAYAWMSPSHDVFSLSPAFNIQLGDFFDLIIPEETPVVGLTDGELERLPTVIYSKTCAGVDHEEKCAVCLSEYTDGEKLKRLRCKHYFHSECIDPWLKTSTQCPICRGQQTS